MGLPCVHLCDKIQEKPIPSPWGLLCWFVGSSEEMCDLRLGRASCWDSEG